MAFLLDTNIIVRLANSADPDHRIADQAVLKLHRQGEVLHLTPQNLIEFRNVATRSKAINGLGLSISDVEKRAADLEVIFQLLPDTPGIFPTWKAMVSTLGIIGKKVHDARLVAVCHVHQVTHLLTFNTTDFAMVAAFGPGLVIVHPGNV